MRADIQGALDQLHFSWKWFEHKGKPMTKQQVKECLEYGKKKGYKYTSEIPYDVIDYIIEKSNQVTGKLFDIPEIKNEVPLNKCKNCIHIYQHEYNQTKYCEMKKSARTSYGHKKIKSNDPACSHFKQKEKKKPSSSNTIVNDPNGPF